MSFWRTFGFTTISPVETILDREHFTLEELLDEEELLQECKSQNKKLLDFLIKPDILETLVGYLTTEAPNADSKRKFKYPFVCCEILCSEVWAICEAFYEHPQLLDKLYSFLDNEPPLNPLLASYVSRVAGALLQRKITETVSFLKQKEELIDRIIKHLESSAVMDLLLKIIACEETPEGKGVLEWLSSANLIPRLVGKLDPSLDGEVHENAAQGLVDIIAVSMNGQSSSPLMAQITSEETSRQLLSYILQEGATTSLLHGLSVVIELVKRNSQETYDRTTTVPELTPLLRVIVEQLDRFKGILDSPPTDQLILSTFGEIQPLGFYRLKVLEFVVSLVKTNYHCVADGLINLNILTTCLDLFFKYEWNNFLHYIIEQLIDGILKTENQDLKLSLLNHSQLLQKIITANKLNNEAVQKEKGTRKGYMGYITAISVQLLNESSKNPQIAEILDANEEWKDYVETDLNNIRQIENNPLGGHKPMSLLDNFSEDDIPDNSTQAVFAQYLSHHGFASNYQDHDDDDDDDEDDYEEDDGEYDHPNNQERFELIDDDQEEYDDDDSEVHVNDQQGQD